MTKWFTATEVKEMIDEVKRDEQVKRQKMASEIALLKRRLGSIERDRASVSEELAREKSMWSTRKDGVPPWEMGDEPTNADALKAHVGEVLDAILRDKAMTNEVSGLAKEKFDFLLKRFEARANRRVGDNPPPLFRGSRGRESNPGTRFELPLRHILLLALACKSEGASQYFLRCLFGISQPTVSRYLAFADSILEVILPTGDRVRWKLSHAESLDEFKQLVPGPGLGIMIFDGTHTERQRPGDKEERDASFGGKFKMHSYMTLVGTNRWGVVLWLGKTMYGSTNDKGALNKNEFSFGKWTDNLHAEYIEPDKRFTLIWDLGFPGVEDLYPGHRVLIGIKRRSGGDLTDEEKEWNKYIGSRRIYVEHGIGECKRFEILQHPFRGPNEKYRKQLNIMSGLANLNLLWDIIRKDAWIGRSL